MSPPSSNTRKLAAAALLAIILVVVGAVVWRELAAGRRIAAEGAARLTPVPGASGFEPKSRPSGPVLANRAPGGLDVDFTYAVDSEPYAYGLTLAFAPGEAEGRARLTVRHDGRTASTESQATRRWDEPRGAFAVALSDKFMVSPPMPALCIKAVVGPDLAKMDLADGTLCVARRDVGGACHPETLACGRLGTR